jgi:hypothetical protein
MGKYQKELIPNKSQPNLDEVGVKTKRTERCYYCNNKIKGIFVKDTSRKKTRLSCFKCGMGKL